LGLEGAMYEDWTVQRWETPVSDWTRILLVYLVDDGALSILLEQTGRPGHRRFMIRFPRFIAYRNILEEYRLELWKRFHCGPELGLGSTWIVTNSSWAASVVAQYPIIDSKEVTHYFIGTEDDVIEVLATATPELSEAPMGDDKQRIGKAEHYYMPEDHQRVKRIIKETTDRQQPPSQPPR
jgi:hypothetical protein